MSFVLWQNWINQETRTTLLPVRVNSSNHLIRSKMRHCQSIFKLIYNHLVLTRLPNWSTCYLATTNRVVIVLRGKCTQDQLSAQSIPQNEWCDVWWWETIPKGQLHKFTPHMHVIIIFFSFLLTILINVRSSLTISPASFLYGRYLWTVHPLWSLPFLTWSLIQMQINDSPERKKEAKEEAWNEK